MKKHGIPVLPGSDGEIEDPKVCRSIAKKLRYPVIVKASAGGGGRGMRIVRSPDELAEAVEAAEREAMAAFGDGTVFVEPYIERGRHIEVQIMGDREGNGILLV